MIKILVELSLMGIIVFIFTKVKAYIINKAKYNLNLSKLSTTEGIYAGTSYKVTKNSSLGLGIGKGYKGDNRTLLYFRTEF